MDQSQFALLLLALSLALLVAEIFIPSGGFITVGALLCLSGSVWCAWQAWWATGQTGMFWSYILAIVLVLPAVLGGAVYLLPRTGMGRRILLEAPTSDDVTPFAAEQEHLSHLIGQTGKTLTLMNPGGLVLVDGERMHSESPGMMIDPGETVEVVAIRGNRLVVRVPSANSKTSAGPLDETQNADRPPLDFDVPQS